MFHSITWQYNIAELLYYKSGENLTNFFTPLFGFLIMALFNSESFRSYDVVVLDGIDYGNFKPGIFGLSLAQIRNIKVAFWKSLQ